MADKLIEEVRARGSMPVWRHGDDEQAFALRITKTGRIALGSAGDVETGAVAQSAEPAVAEPAAASTESSSKTARASRSRRPASANAERSSKQDTVLAMLKETEGTTISAIMAVTGWQQHSVRGFFAGVVRKKLGLALVSEKGDGDRVYRIAPAGDAVAAAENRKAG